jgi:hypothetical protein
MSCAEEGKGLGAIERRLADEDPALAEAFQRWQVPEGAPDTQDGGTVAQPWVLAVFVTAAVSWVVSPGFGVLVAAVALFWVLVDADQRRGRVGLARAAGRDAADAPTCADGPDDGGLPPPRWRGGWI